MSSQKVDSSSRCDKIKDTPSSCATAIPVNNARAGENRYRLEVSITAAERKLLEPTYKRDLRPESAFQSIKQVKSTPTDNHRRQRLLISQVEALEKLRGTPIKELVNASKNKKKGEPWKAGAVAYEASKKAGGSNIAAFKAAEDAFERTKGAENGKVVGKEDDEGETGSDMDDYGEDIEMDEDADAEAEP